MKNSQNNSMDDSNLSHEKKNWVSPELEKWGTNHLEFGIGAGPDGGGFTYNQ